MGTNVYMRRREPRMVPEYDETHVCKISAGWRVHFDGSSAWDNSWDPRGEQAPRIGSIDDLRGYLQTGEWVLVDEYGDETTLDKVLSHDDYVYEGELRNTRVSPDDYLDREGHPWSRREFA